MHKKLMKSEIITVEDFLHVLVRDPQRLRNILGSGMSNRMWDNTVEHAKTCVLGGKLYIYYADRAHSTGAVFNHIYELRGLITDGQFLPLESLNHNQKISLDALVKGAYENWNQVVEYDGKVLNALSINKKGTKGLTASTADQNHITDHYYQTTEKQQHVSSDPIPQSHNKINNPTIPQLIEFPLRSDSLAGVTLNTQQVPLLGNIDYGSAGVSAVGGSYILGDCSGAQDGQRFGDFFSEEIRLRSSEMLESDDMQRLLKNLGMESAFSHSEDTSYCYNVPYETNHTYEQERGRSSGKAVVGWLKLKAALRWGIFIRRKAAERRAQLVELD